MGQIGIAKAVSGSFMGMYYFFLETNNQRFAFTTNGWQPIGVDLPLGTACYATQERAEEEYVKLIEYFESKMGVSLKEAKQIKEDIPFICLQCKNHEFYNGGSPCRDCMYHPKNKERKADCQDHFKNKKEK